MSDFSDFGLHPDLLRGIESVGFEQPTPIQQDAIPPALAGQDVLACAMTGSGKTAAFLLPILHRLHDKPRGTTRVLVLAPTRELAAQIVEHMQGLAQFTDIKGAAVFGGVAMGPQEKNFRKGVDILVATPGRLLDHFQNDYAKLDGLEILVLDEADRMLDMGFLPDVRRVLQHLPRPEQTLFFSATLPQPIVELAGEMLREPARLNVERKSAPATGITQAVYPVSEDLKPYLLVELLRRGDIKNVLVFTRTKHRANRLAEFLDKQGVSCDRIHGNRSQAQRTDALGRFKNGTLQVLVATDIAARGIDVEALSHVINFDVPNIPEDYIHRVGRTARAGIVGDAFTFVADEEREELNGMIRALAMALSVAEVDAETIDRVNIYQATRMAMLAAVQGLPIAPDHLLIDAMRVDHVCPQTRLFYGDALSLSIAAASVVAKVHRDGLMRELDLLHPAYGLASHKGYGTPQHRKALAEHGPCALHRRTFAPVGAADPDLALEVQLMDELLFDDDDLEDATL